MLARVLDARLGGEDSRRDDTIYDSRITGCD